MPRGFYAIISRCGAARKPGSGNGKPWGGMGAPARARAARAAPEPTCPHRATQPARRGRGEREQTREACGRATGCATAREGFAAGFQRRSAGGQPRRTAGKRRTQQCAGAAALLCRHAGARAPTTDDVPTMKGGAHRRPEHGHETPGRHPRRTAGDALTGGFARERFRLLLLDIRHRIPSIE